jgi:hypothetical protein
VTDARPPEGPDRDALVAAMIDAAERRDDETTPFYEALADAVLALLPTMPAPGGGEGLRAEVENAVTDLQAEWASLTSDPGSTGYRTGLGAAITRVRAALARATPEAEEGKP